MTRAEDKLTLGTTLQNLNDKKTGGPLSGRDEKLVAKLKQEYKAGKGAHREYAQKKWEGPNFRRLAERTADDSMEFDQFAFEGHRESLAGKASSPEV